MLSIFFLAGIDAPRLADVTLDKRVVTQTVAARKKTRYLTKNNTKSKIIGSCTIDDSDTDSLLFTKRVYQNYFVDVYDMRMIYKYDVNDKHMMIHGWDIKNKDSVKEPDTTSEIERLDNNTAWYSSNIINSWIYILANKYPTQSESILIIDSFVAETKLMNLKIDFQHYNHYDLKGKKYAVFPYNPSGDHWLFGIAFFSENKLVVYNSIPGEKQFKKDLEGLKKLFLFLKKSLIYQKVDEEFEDLEIEATYELYDSFPQQSDGYMCGAFACKGLEIFYKTLNMEITWDAGEDIRMYREEMKQFYKGLFENGKPLEASTSSSISI